MVAGRFLTFILFVRNVLNLYQDIRPRSSPVCCGGKLCNKSEADQTAAASPQPLDGVELTEEVEEKC